MNELKIKVNGAYKTVRAVYRRVNGSYRYVGEVEKKVGDSYKEFSMGFPRTVEGVPPLSLLDARAKPLTRNVISGNTKRTITIDGTEYVVPDGITLLESIDNNGTAYLDLGMPIGATDVITFDIAWNSLVNSPYFGAYNTGGAYNHDSFNGTYSSNGSGKMFYDDSASISLFSPTAGERGTLKWNGVGVKPTWNEEEFGSTPTIDFTPSVNAYLGTRNQGGTAGSVDDITLYSFKVERNNNVVMLLFGAKNASNVVGVYDFIRGIFIAPAVGSFTAGSELPTPEHPLGVKGCGDKTENLFDKDTMGTSCNASLSSIGSISVNGTSGTFKIPCEPNTQYTIGFIDELGTNKFRVATTENEFVGTAMATLDHYRSTTVKTYTFTTNADAHWMYLQTNAANFDDVKNVLMLVKGSTAPTSYIHYGYKVTELLASNVCIVDIGTLNWTYRGDLAIGEFFCNTSSWTIPKKVGTTNLYTNGYTTINTSGTGMGDKTICGHISAQAIYIRDTRFTNATAFKAAMSGKYLYYQRTTDTAWTPPTTITAYLDKPLGKVGPYADTFDMATGEHAENVGVKVFDGTENWTDASIGTKHIYYAPIVDRLTGADYKYGFCSHFNYSTAASSSVPDLSMFFYGSVNVGIRYDAVTSLADWTAYLAAQYAAGTPLAAWYPLASETTGQVTAQSLVLPRGNVILDSDNEVKASNISATYKSQTNQ